MNRKGWLTLIALTWLALPTIAARYWLAWDRLPPRLATHFDAAGHVNGWMLRENSLLFALISTAAVLVVMTLVLSRVQKPEASSWAVLGFVYVIVGVLAYAQVSTLNYNLYGRPVRPWPVVITALVAALIVVAAILNSKRGESLPAAGVLADEVHASHLWGLVLGVLAAVELFAAAIFHSVGLRIVMGFGASILLLAAVFAWRGFHYVFSNAGVEVRSLGFRLRSIPLNQIREYGVDRWSVLAGYGIRDLGDCRAYVWGNTGIRIKTGAGEVFLGHSQPERLIHDLELIKQAAH